LELKGRGTECNLAVRMRGGGGGVKRDDAPRCANGFALEIIDANTPLEFKTPIWRERKTTIGGM